MSKPQESYWRGRVPDRDNWGRPIADEFIDGRSGYVRVGAWGFFTPQSWRIHGCGQLGPGFGQRYQRQPSGRWKKVEG